MGGQIAYNPDDPLQQSFLSALVDAGNLSGLPADQSGLQNVAAEYGINLSTASGDNEALWDLAQQQYSTSTGGQSLETALQTPSAFSNIQSALAGLWPSVTGSEAAPQGLASQLEANISNAGTTTTASGPVSSAASPAAGTTTTASGLSGFFVRGGLLFVGGLIIVVGLWALLAKQGYVPGLKFGKG